MTRYNKNHHLQSMKLMQGVTSKKTNEKISVKDLNYKVLIDEMSKSTQELFNETFERVSQITGTSITSVRSYWSLLRHEIPAIFSKYPYLTREQKEILTIKSTAFERTPVEKTNSWSDEDVKKVLELIAKFYVPGKPKKYVYEQVSKEIGKSPKTIEILWYNKLRNIFTTINITPQEKGIIAKFAKRPYAVKKVERQTLTDKSHIRENNKQDWKEKEVDGKKLGKRNDIPEFRSNNFRNQNVNNILDEFNEEEVKEVRPEDIACPNFLEKFGIKPSQPKTEAKTEVKQLPENSYEESEYIFRKVSDDEYEVLKGVVKINKDIVSTFLNSNKTVVLDEENIMIAKNYL